MRQIQITIPNEKLHGVLDALLELKVKGIHVISGETDSLMIFRIHITRVPSVLEELTALGIGIVSGIIDILEIKATIPPLEELSLKTGVKIQSRMPIEELHRELISNSELTYRFLIFSLLSSVLAGIGLIYNNGVIIITAMVLSPLLGPILALSYSFEINNRNLMKVAMKSELIGFIIAISCGIILGSIFFSVFPTIPMLKPFLSIPSFKDYLIPTEMLLHGKWSYFAVNTVIAIIMGIAVGFVSTEGIASSAVGIAIGTSIVPPIVNAGICFVVLEFELGLVSALVFLVNFLAITLTSIFIFKFKKIRAPTKTFFLWQGPKLPKEKIEEVVEVVEEKPKGFRARLFRRGEKKQLEKELKEKKVVKKDIQQQREEIKPEVQSPVLKEEFKTEIKEAVKEALAEERRGESEKEEKNKKESTPLEKEIKSEIKEIVKDAITEKLSEEKKKDTDEKSK